MLATQPATNESGGEISASLQRSNAPLERFDRYRASLYGSATLPLELLLHVSGVLQISRDQTSIALQHLADQKEVFLVVARQEHSQWRDSRFCCC